MEENNEIANAAGQSKVPRFDRSDLLSILAVLVSLSALAVSFYEAGLLRKQSSLMQEQQKASVWPYLEVSGNYMYGNEVEVKYSFVNKGVGPAKIKSFTMTINGKVFSGYEEIKAFFLGLFPEAKDMTVVFGGLGGVVAADEKTDVFYLKIEGVPNAQEIVPQLMFKYEICYCSIYDECWYLNSEAEEPILGCN